MNENFVPKESLMEHLRWRNQNFDEKLCMELASLLSFEEDIAEFGLYGLDSAISSDEQESVELGKKIAVLRVLSHKARIVVIKDTSPFIGNWSIVELLQRYNPGCTIIKITNTLEVAYDCQRIIYLEKLRLREDNSPGKLVHDRLSKVGEMLRFCNEETYIFRNKAALLKRKHSK